MAVNATFGTREQRPLPAPVPDILTTDALAFVKRLTLCFRGSLKGLLAEREQRQADCDLGLRPGFLRETEATRQGDWSVAPLPVTLMDRRVEITSPPAPGALSEALNSGARVCVADFEDGLVPTLENLVTGQESLYRAIRGDLGHQGPETGARQGLNPKAATLMVRPRGLHLPEPHLEVEGAPVPACIFDAGLFLFHNAAELLARGSGPYLCLAKLEHHLEARWWDQVLEAVENDLGLPTGSIRTTLLISTLPAAFQMDEILHEHLNRAAGLALAQQDYLFSYLKTFRTDPSAILPDRQALTLEQPLLRACTQLMVRTCHRRGCSALGGLSAAAPGDEDPEVRVRADALREVLEGCDGAQVAHPALVPVALEVFDEHMHGLNQLHRIPLPAADLELLAVPSGPRTGSGLRQDLRVGIRYLESWLRGEGRVELYGLVEDTASAEIARMHLWQWVNHEVEVPSMGRLDRPLFHWHVQDALYQIQAEVGDEVFADGRFIEAADILETLILLPTPPPFLAGSVSALLAEAP